jgi:hypothetical protein
LRFFRFCGVLGSGAAVAEWHPDRNGERELWVRFHIRSEEIVKTQFPEITGFNNDLISNPTRHKSFNEPNANAFAARISSSLCLCASVVNPLFDWFDWVTSEACAMVHPLPSISQQIRNPPLPSFVIPWKIFLNADWGSEFGVVGCKWQRSQSVAQRLSCREIGRATLKRQQIEGAQLRCADDFLQEIMNRRVLSRELARE